MLSYVNRQLYNKSFFAIYFCLQRADDTHLLAAYKMAAYNIAAVWANDAMEMCYNIHTFSHHPLYELHQPDAHRVWDIKGMHGCFHL